MLGQASAGEGTVTWGRGNPPHLACLQWKVCTTSWQTPCCCWDLLKDFVQQAHLSILDDQESGSCREGAFSSDTGQVRRGQHGWLVWEGLKLCQFTYLAPVLRSHAALKKPQMTSHYPKLDGKGLAATHQG